VDSENNMYRQQDVWRHQQMLCSLADRQHPFSKFMVGSKETLRHDQAMRDRLVDFFTAYYSSNVMNLAILSTSDLDTLQKTVEEQFSDIVDRNVSLRSNACLPFPKSVLRQMYTLEPVGNIQKMILTWQIAPTDGHYRTQPANFIALLIERSQSLIATLKNRDLAHSVSAGVSIAVSSFSLFTVVLVLTDKGSSLERFFTKHFPSDGRRLREFTGGRGHRLRFHTVSPGTMLFM
jgi:insulysin